MDKAPVYGTGDSRFDPWKTQRSTFFAILLSTVTFCRPLEDTGNTFCSHTCTRPAPSITSVGVIQVGVTPVNGPPRKPPQQPPRAPLRERAATPPYSSRNHLLLPATTSSTSLATPGRLRKSPFASSRPAAAPCARTLVIQGGVASCDWGRCRVHCSYIL
jgi:hypothetical protein